MTNSKSHHSMLHTSDGGSSGILRDSACPPVGGEGGVFQIANSKAFHEMILTSDEVSSEILTNGGRTIPTSGWRGGGCIP